MHFADLSGVLVLMRLLLVEVNLSTITCWGYYQILNIRLSLLVSVNVGAGFCTIYTRVCQSGLCRTPGVCWVYKNSMEAIKPS